MNPFHLQRRASAGVGRKHLKGLARLDRVAGKRGVRYDADETGLRKRARRSAARTMLHKPLHRSLVLDGARHGDPALRAQLEALLAAHEQPATLLNT